MLSPAQRDHLRKFLPQFPENNREQQDGIVAGLFGGDDFRFGNPLHIAQKLFRGEEMVAVASNECTVVLSGKLL